jgi:glutathione S-transferase
MDEHLGTTPWIAGDNFTFADIDLVCTVEFAGWIKDGIPESCSNLQSWQERATAELA